MEEIFSVNFLVDSSMQTITTSFHQPPLPEVDDVDLQVGFSLYIHHFYLYVISNRNKVLNFASEKNILPFRM
jgi:hypothetical protein